MRQFAPAAAIPVAALAVVALAAGTAGWAGDPSTHSETTTIKLNGRPFHDLTAICVNSRDELLACDGGGRVYVLAPDGAIRATLQPGLEVRAVAVAEDGTIFVAGEGKLGKLDGNGRLARSVRLGGERVSSLTVSDRDVFVSVSQRTGFTILRFNLDLGEKETIARSLRGCCGTLDIAARGGRLYVAENSRHRVLVCDRDGKVLAKWGSSGSDRATAAFGGCCNPMNLCVPRDDDVLTAEAGPDRIKRFRASGTFVEQVGLFTGGKSCSCVDIAASRDGSRIYIGDANSRTIRVLERKLPLPETAPAPPVVRGPGPSAGVPG